MAATIRVENLIKTVGNKKLLSNLFLKIDQKEIVGLFGRNGSGKTTLMKIMFGVVKADQLFFSYEGKRIFLRTRFSRFLAYSPQECMLPKRIRVRQLLQMTLSSQHVEHLAVDELISTVLDKRVGELSSGTAKYLQTQLILCHTAPFCLLDEPFTGLSPILCNQLAVSIKKAAEEKGILVSDHYYKRLLPLAHKNYLLKNGALYSVTNEEDLTELHYLR